MATVWPLYQQTSQQQEASCGTLYRNESLDLVLLVSFLFLPFFLPFFLSFFLSLSLHLSFSFLLSFYLSLSFLLFFLSFYLFLISVFLSVCLSFFVFYPPKVPTCVGTYTFRGTRNFWGQSLQCWTFWTEWLSAVFNFACCVLKSIA